ncbi:site-specific integrase [Priestia flexa]|uniref:Site-specific integrase n=1 Tax=Priestia flexa TaxID=86664 RepID=A0ABU4J245_9BACI|nr:site-specific integrase [Priestia flexa]MDW8515063.1 site-specific integrase [Priestia flexa]
MKGYFRKRGKVWSYTVDIGKDPLTGKRRQKTKGGFRTKKDAERDCADFISSFNKGSAIIQKDITIKEFMKFFIARSELKLKPSTFYKQMNVFNKHIVPRIGHIKLQEFTKHHAQEFINQLLEKELSPTYIAHICRLARIFFEFALKDDRIVRNPFSDVITPRTKKRSYNVWSVEQLQTFLATAKEWNQHYYTLYILAAHTGMRIGEVLGLRWRDVDFENKRISVNQSVYYKEREFVFSDLKTSNSFRMIAVDDVLVKQLKRHKSRQIEGRLAEPFETDYDLVFCRKNGRPLHPEAVRGSFNRMIVRANVPKIRLHDLRHTHATILLKMRENPKIVSERLGHSTVVRTLDTYSHVLPDMQEEAVSKFSDLMNRKFSS